MQQNVTKYLNVVPYPQNVMEYRSRKGMLQNDLHPGLGAYIS